MVFDENRRVFSELWKYEVSWRKEGGVSGRISQNAERKKKKKKAMIIDYEEEDGCVWQLNRMELCL